MQNRPMHEQCCGAFLRVYLQGQFVLEQRLCAPDNEVAYEVIAPEKWEHRKHVQRLLTILLSRPGRRARRSYLMDELWPETDAELAGQYLKTTISKLRYELPLD